MAWELLGSGTGPYEVQSDHKRVALINHTDLETARKMAAADGLLALVEAVEWIRKPTGAFFCAWCKELYPDHKDDCDRQRTLARARGQQEDTDE